MRHRPLLRIALAFALGGAVSCGSTIDLSQALTVTETFTGWYDDGVVQEGSYKGWAHLVPQITFKIKNAATEPVSSVQLLVSYWAVGADGPVDDREVLGIGGDALAPGALTNAVTVRSTVGHNLQAARADFFTHSNFKDFVAKVFAKRGGRIYRLGEFPIERRIIPHMSAPGRP
jgi:hypothetical protein